MTANNSRVCTTKTGKYCVSQTCVPLILEIASGGGLCNTFVTFTRAPVGTSFGPHQCVAGWFLRSFGSEKLWLRN